MRKSLQGANVYVFFGDHEFVMRLFYQSRQSNYTILNKTLIVVEIDEKLIGQEEWLSLKTGLPVRFLIDLEAVEIKSTKIDIKVAFENHG